jgi:hypothetical protein
MKSFQSFKLFKSFNGSTKLTMSGSKFRSS